MTRILGLFLIALAISVATVAAVVVPNTFITPEHAVATYFCVAAAVVYGYTAMNPPSLRAFLLASLQGAVLAGILDLGDITQGRVAPMVLAIVAWIAILGITALVMWRRQLGTASSAIDRFFSWLGITWLVVVVLVESSPLTTFAFGKAMQAIPGFSKALQARFVISAVVVAAIFIRALVAGARYVTGIPKPPDKPPYPPFDLPARYFLRPVYITKWVARAARILAEWAAAIISLWWRYLKTMLTAIWAEAWKVLRRIILSLDALYVLCETLGRVVLAAGIPILALRLSSQMVNYVMTPAFTVSGALLAFAPPVGILVFSYIVFRIERGTSAQIVNSQIARQLTIGLLGGAALAFVAGLVCWIAPIQPPVGGARLFPGWLPIYSALFWIVAVLFGKGVQLDTLTGSKTN